MNRRLSHLLSISGLFLMALAFVLFAGHGVPYPDATPEQVVEQNAGLMRFNLTFFSGLICLATGIVLLLIRRRKGNRVS